MAMKQVNVITGDAIAADERQDPSLRLADGPEPSMDGAAAAALIASIATDRDRQAFARLFAFYAPRLRTFLGVRGFSDSDADDLIQDTMLTVWRKAEGFDPARGAASTWIFRICHNLGIDRRRRLGRRKTETELFPFVDVDLSPSAEGVLLTREAEGRMRDALRQLPPEQSEVITLSFYAQTPQADISAKLGIPLGTVKSRVRLAMKRLRQLLEEPT